MTGFVQPTLFTPPDVDIRRLRDTDRTVLEAIGKLGAISPRKAGQIVYRLNRRRRPIDPAVAYRYTGRKVLERLTRLGLVTPDADGQFTLRPPDEAAAA